MVKAISTSGLFKTVDLAGRREIKIPETDETQFNQKNINFENIQKVRMTHTLDE